MFVVFVLFAISVAGLTGYLLVSSEHELARYSGQGAEALTVARGGLERFAAEQLGVVPDTVSYALGRGIATVTTRKLYTVDPVTDMYYLRSEGTVDDIRTPDAPARRVVGGYAVRRRRPVRLHAAVLITADDIDVTDPGEILGRDQQVSLGCSTGGPPHLTGAIARLGVTEDDPSAVRGNPDYELWPGGWSGIVDSVGVRWDVITDPEFPVDYENTLPDFGALPPDSFPVIRYTGWVSAGFSGRGVLIVDGVFDPTTSFNWDGIVLAGQIDDMVEGFVDGILIAGLEGPNPYASIDFRADVNYHSCYVHAANESLSYLELLPNTVFELN